MPLPAGATLLPGLRDAHVHLGLIDPYALAAGGIAAADDLGGVPRRIATLAELSRNHRSGLPRIRYAGAFLTAADGYPGGRSWAPPGSWREVRSMDDAQLAVHEQLSAGATLIKVALNSAAGPVFSSQILSSIVIAAAGRRVVAHAEGPGMAELALAAGVDELAHTPWTQRLSAGVIRDAAAQQSWISTLAIHSGVAREIAVQNLRLFLDQGGRVRYGTDLGNGPLPLGVNAREIRALQDAGMSPDDILAAMAVDQDEEGIPACYLPEPGLDRDPARFAASLSRARVISPQEGWM